MSKFFKIGVVGLLALAALGFALSGSAFAQDGTDETPTPPASNGWYGKGFGRLFPGGQVGLEAAAEALNMSVEDLQNQLWAGETLASLAEKAGVDLADLRAAVEEAQMEAVRQRIQQAVDNGNLEQDHADWLLEGLDKGYLGGPGFGRGFGRGFGMGFGMRGGFRGGFHGFDELPDATQVAPSGGA
jgi:hypothetical protein